MMLAQLSIRLRGRWVAAPAQSQQCWCFRRIWNLIDKLVEQCSYLRTRIHRTTRQLCIIISRAQSKPLIWKISHWAKMKEWGIACWCTLNRVNIHALELLSPRDLIREHSQQRIELSAPQVQYGEIRMKQASVTPAVILVRFPLSE